jgi:hypothetical protein
MKISYVFFITAIIGIIALTSTFVSLVAFLELSLLRVSLMCVIYLIGVGSVLDIFKTNCLRDVCCSDKEKDRSDG